MSLAILAGMLSRQLTATVSWPKTINYAHVTTNS